MKATVAMIADQLQQASDVLLVAHVNPDADALGSTLATGMALEGIGVRAQVTCPDEPFAVPASLRFLPREDLIVDPVDLVPSDTVLAMDAASADRVGRLLPLGLEAPTFIAIDHHASFEPFAPIWLVDDSCPATGLLALHLIDALGVELTEDIALCLYAAISSDTGSFRYSSTTPDTLRVAARLMETGIDFAGAAKAMFDTKSQAFLALEGDMLSRLESREADGVTVVVGRVSAEDRRRYGIEVAEVESLIDVVRTVDSADVAVVLKEDDAGHWRVSSRSLGSVDVLRACARLGGGGHRLAAGFTGGPDPDVTLADFLAALS